ncbi:hypothetical protein ACGVWS_06755 [Enterobacteriaceae bacterium LUAb1]
MTHFSNSPGSSFTSSVLNFNPGKKGSPSYSSSHTSTTVSKNSRVLLLSQALQESFKITFQKIQAGVFNRGNAITVMETGKNISKALLSCVPETVYGSLVSYAVSSGMESIPEEHRQFYAAGVYAAIAVPSLITDGYNARTTYKRTRSLAAAGMECISVGIFGSIMSGVAYLKWTGYNFNENASHVIAHILSPFFTLMAEDLLGAMELEYPGEKFNYKKCLGSAAVASLSGNLIAAIASSLKPSVELYPQSRGAKDPEASWKDISIDAAIENSTTGVKKFVYGLCQSGTLPLNAVCEIFNIGKIRTFQDVKHSVRKTALRIQQTHVISSQYTLAIVINTLIYQLFGGSGGDMITSLFITITLATIVDILRHFMHINYDNKYGRGHAHHPGLPHHNQPAIAYTDASAMPFGLTRACR